MKKEYINKFNTIKTFNDFIFSLIPDSKGTKLEELKSGKSKYTHITTKGFDKIVNPLDKLEEIESKN